MHISSAIILPTALEDGVNVNVCQSKIITRILMMLADCGLGLQALKVVSQLTVKIAYVIMERLYAQQADIIILFIVSMTGLRYSSCTKDQYVPLNHLKIKTVIG